MSYTWTIGANRDCGQITSLIRTQTNLPKGLGKNQISIGMQWRVGTDFIQPESDYQKFRAVSSTIKFFLKVGFSSGSESRSKLEILTNFSRFLTLSDENETISKSGSHNLKTRAKLILIRRIIKRVTAGLVQKYEQKSRYAFFVLVLNFCL